MSIFSVGKWLRPSREKWAPHSNCSDNDDVLAFEMAAKKIGVSIKFGYPVSCSAGADICAGLGMKGVYILRSQIDKKDALQTAKWEAQRELAR